MSNRVEMLILSTVLSYSFNESCEQAWWLLHHSVDLTPAAAVMNVIVFVIGYYRNQISGFPIFQPVAWLRIYLSNGYLKFLSTTCFGAGS